MLFSFNGRQHFASAVCFAVELAQRQNTAIFYFINATVFHFLFVIGDDPSDEIFATWTNAAVESSVVQFETIESF